MAFEYLSDKLVALRKANHLSQQQVADAIGINRSAYAYYEVGKSKPKFQALASLAGIYGMSIDDLLNDVDISKLKSPTHKYKTSWSIDETMTTLSDYEQCIVLKTRLLNSEKKQALLSFIEKELLQE